MILTVVGLSLFEIITSIDNAIINAEVLSGMSKKAQRWFLLWGFFFAVFVVRGLLPLVIVWVANPGLQIMQVFTAAFSSDPAIAEAIQKTAPLLKRREGDFFGFNLPVTSFLCGLRRILCLLLFRIRPVWEPWAPSVWGWMSRSSSRRSWWP